MPPQQKPAKDIAAGIEAKATNQETHEESLEGAKHRTGLTEVVEATRSASTGDHGT